MLRFPEKINITRYCKKMPIFFISALPFLLLPFFLVSGRLDARVQTTRSPAYESVLRAASRTEVPHPLSAEAHARTNALAPLSRPVPERVKIGYDSSVLRAMKEMALVTDHFDTWISQHPGSALAHLRYMPASMQRNVASTALFIRKSNARIDEKTAWREATALVHYSAKYGIPSAWATAVAYAESTFDPDAVSPKGASGVMQVMWRIHNGLLQSNGIRATPGPNPLSDPEQAIAAGCLLLSRYVKAYGSVKTAMDRYYGGRSDAYQRKVNRNIARIMNHRAELLPD